MIFSFFVRNLIPKKFSNVLMPLLISCLVMKCIIYGLFSVFLILRNVKGLHPHVGLDEYQIMSKYGYPYEKHHVTTEDGYILELIRILPKRYSIPFNTYPKLMPKTRGEPILLMHGMMFSGRAFLAHDPDKALAFLLVNHGYDVFIGNARGTTRSRRHVTLDPNVDSKEFFDFSFHEIAVFDIPAIIDYILELTGYTQVSYVGYSQGGTTLYVMCAHRPEYNAKIKIGLSLGGPALMKYTPNSSLKRIALYEQQFQGFLERLQIYEFLRATPLVMDLLKIFTDEQFGLRDMFKTLMDNVNVITSYNMDLDVIPSLFTGGPSGSSWNQVLHYGQSVNSGEFRQFDYANKSRNIEKYGSEIPPRYNLSAVTCPVILYHSKFDRFIQGRDAMLMAKQMLNATPVGIKVKHFSHTDYMWAQNIVNIVFKDLLWRLKNA